MLNRIDLTKWGPITVVVVGLTLVAALAVAALLVIEHPPLATVFAGVKSLWPYVLGSGLIGGGHAGLQAARELASAHRDAAIVQAGAGGVSGLSEGAGKAEGGDGFAETPTA